MGKYAIKRILKAVLYIFIICTIIFFLMRQVTIVEAPGRIEAKPVIYLYPETETQVTVKMDYSGKLTCTYPAYNNGWQVTAAPDGTLTDASGQTYNYLYWEGETATEYDLSEGFCVAGTETAAFTLAMQPMSTGGEYICALVLPCTVIAAAPAASRRFAASTATSWSAS